MKVQVRRSSLVVGEWHIIGRRPFFIELLIQTHRAGDPLEHHVDTLMFRQSWLLLRRWRRHYHSDHVGTWRVRLLDSYNLINCYFFVFSGASRQTWTADVAMIVKLVQLDIVGWPGQLCDTEESLKVKYQDTEAHVRWITLHQPSYVAIGKLLKNFAKAERT